MTATNRLLDPERLPQALWDSDNKILRLPNALARAYEMLIDRHGLRELAQSRTVKDSPVGGLGKPETDKHFAQQFDNSAARVQLALTNATMDVARVSNALVQALSGNMVCITDAPCGAGAAAFSLLGKPATSSLTILTEAEQQAMAVIALNGVTMQPAGTNLANKSELLEFAKIGSNTRLMNSGNTFIREIACLHGIVQSPRHPEMLESVFDEDEDFAIDAVDQLQQSLSP